MNLRLWLPIFLTLQYLLIICILTFPTKHNQSLLTHNPDSFNTKRINPVSPVGSVNNLIRAASANTTLSQKLEQNPEYRVEWERTIIPRQLALMILTYRTKHQMNMTQFAKHAGMTQTQIRRLEGGNIDLKASTITRLLKILGNDLLILNPTKAIYRGLEEKINPQNNASTEEEVIDEHSRTILEAEPAGQWDLTVGA